MIYYYQNARIQIHDNQIKAVLCPYGFKCIENKNKRQGSGVNTFDLLQSQKHHYLIKKTIGM